MNQLTVQTQVNKPIEQVWDLFTNPKHIVQWNFAHESWECPSASNDLQVGGLLQTRMQAKDGSFGFDLIGIYDEVVEHQSLKYHLEDGRNVEVIFENLSGDKTRITENFAPENQNPVDLQKDGWQAILDHFKTYAEAI